MTVLHYTVHTSMQKIHLWIITQLLDSQFRITKPLYLSMNVNLISYNTVFQTEIPAKFLAINWAIKTHHITAVIFTDRYSSINALNKLFLFNYITIKYFIFR